MRARRGATARRSAHSPAVALRARRALTDGKRAPYSSELRREWAVYARNGSTRRRHHLLPSLLPFLFLGCATGPASTDDEGPSGPINAAIGDESFGRTYGRAPTPADDDVLRITTHLRFVEATLRARDVSHLTPAQQTARIHLLDRLNAYWRAGAFPRNLEGTARVPRFVEPASEDSPRRVCAVGAIAEPDLGATAIDEIAVRHEHDYIASIHDPAFESWATASGLTLDELAMIQPSYGFMRPRPGGELSDAEVTARLSLQQGLVNECVTDALSAQKPHPAGLTVNLVITQSGAVRDVVISGTTNPTIKACVERTVSELPFRSTPKPKRALHTFSIVGPRTSDGLLDAAYLPTLFRRADADVNRCGKVLSVPNTSSLLVSVRTELDPQGVLRVRNVRADVEGAPIPRSMTTCITRAVESLTAPTFRGAAQEHEHVYKMELASPVASMDF